MNTGWTQNTWASHFSWVTTRCHYYLCVQFHFQCPCCHARVILITFTQVAAYLYHITLFLFLNTSPLIFWGKTWINCQTLNSFNVVRTQLPNLACLQTLLGKDARNSSKGLKVINVQLVPARFIFHEVTSAPLTQGALWLELRVCKWAASNQSSSWTV